MKLKGKEYAYLGHFKEEKYLRAGHNTNEKMNKEKLSDKDYVKVLSAEERKKKLKELSDEPDMGGYMEDAMEEAIFNQYIKKMNKRKSDKDIEKK